MALMEAAFGCVLCFCGIVCSTWVAINAGTSLRSILVPSGDISKPAIRRGNIMCARIWVSNDLIFQHHFNLIVLGALSL